MFATAESGATVSKQEYERVVPGLRVDLLNAQFDLQRARFSVVVLLVGDDRKGCNELLDLMPEWMDARGMQTHVFLEPTQEQRAHPRYWRYWRALPAKGTLAVHFGAWVTEAIAGHVLGEFDDEQFEHRIEQVRRFERTITRDGSLLLKFWLHVPKRELKRRLKRADRELYVDDRDAVIYDHHEQAMADGEHFLRLTDTPHAPWQIVEGSQRRHRNLTVMSSILHAIRERLELVSASDTASDQASASDSDAVDSVAPLHPAPSTPALPSRGDPTGALAAVDLTRHLNRRDYRDALEKHQARLSRLVHKAHKRGVSTVLAFEGWDAAGKGGAIRRVTSAVPARFYRVLPVAAPSDEERAHHYLWRFWRQLPRAGHMAVFDRSWYGRVLVERVEGFARPDEWAAAYEEINAFEEQLVSHGTVLGKFWMHIDPEEQLRRFEARTETPYKKYKLTADDYRNRDQWGAYEVAVNEMVARTSTDSAPWHLVPANNKHWARIQVLETVCALLRKALRKGD